MAYTLGIPSDGQSLGNSKPQVRGNFTSIFNTFALNHIAFNSIGEGKHKFVEMPEVADQATSSDEIGLYCKEAQSFSNLFWRQESGGADPLKNQGAIIQMTNILPINATTGRTFLPGGFLLQWGIVTLNGSGVQTVNFPSTFTLSGVNNDPWNIQVTMADTTFVTIRTVGISAYAFDQFSISSFAGANQDVFWCAIGPKT